MAVVLGWGLGRSRATSFPTVKQASSKNARCRLAENNPNESQRASRPGMRDITGRLNCFTIARRTTLKGGGRAAPFTPTPAQRAPAIFKGTSRPQRRFCGWLSLPGSRQQLWFSLSCCCSRTQPETFKARPSITGYVAECAEPFSASSGWASSLTPS